MDAERLQEIREFATRFGCANCWTGTVGTACVYLREFLAEIDRREQPPAEVAARDAAV